MSQSTVLLEHHLKQLKLPTMLREYTPVAAGCSKDRCDYPTYLLRLAERLPVRVAMSSQAELWKKLEEEDLRINACEHAVRIEV